MDKLPTDFTTLLATASLVEKRAMLIALSDNIRELEAKETNDIVKLKDYVDYVPNFVKDIDLINGVQKELNSMKIDAPNTKQVKTFWLNSTLDNYAYTGKNNPAHLISNYPNIYKLLQIVNKSEHSNNELNSCLVACYGNARKSLSLHSDDEPEICQKSPLLNITFGATRKIEFEPKYGKNTGKIICSYDLDHGSLNIMKPGCNLVLKHRVPPGDHIVNGNNVRYILSFRKFIPPSQAHDTPQSPVMCNISYFNQLGDADNIKPDSTQGDKKVEAVLIAGDSHLQKLDGDKLGKNRIVVKNIAKGGARICDTENAISDFFSSNSQYKIVKVFVSVGTNDIRYCRRGVLHLTKPLRLLAERIKLCFPSAKIWFQSLLPLPIVNPFVKSNVENFNRLLVETCTNHRIYLHDVFYDFLGLDSHRNHYLFEKNINNVHLNSVGLGKLAKKYINLIHRRQFDPRIFNTL